MVSHNNLYAASKQWATRPDDERFGSIPELVKACQDVKNRAAQARPAWKDLMFSADANEVLLRGANGGTSRLGHFAFGQVAHLAEAPASFLRTLTPETAAKCLNESLRQKRPEGIANLLLHQNSPTTSKNDLILRAITTDHYKRVWDVDVATAVGRLAESGNWRVAPARPAFVGQRGTRKATQADVLGGADMPGLSIKVGDMIAPAGLYASDHDMFAFLVDPTKRIEDGSEGGLYRGFFVWNSEVGDRSFGLMTFLYRSVCGNHIVWGTENVTEIRMSHVGTINHRAFSALSNETRSYADSSMQKEQAKVDQARRFQLEDTKEKVITLVRLKTRLGKGDAFAAYEYAEKNEKQDGSPRSAWGFAQGITRLSQESNYSDDRLALDRAAGKVLELAF